MPGPPRTPTPILKLRGSWRAKERERHGEPQPEKGRPRCPRWLDRRAKAAWRQLIPRLEKLGVLAECDGNALIRYCQLWSRWRHAEEWIQKHGSVWIKRDEDGKPSYVQQWPEVAIAHKLVAALLRHEEQFGLTPAARARIQVPDGADAEEDELSEFLNRGMR